MMICGRVRPNHCGGWMHFSMLLCLLWVLVPLWGLDATSAGAQSNRVDPEARREHAVAPPSSDRAAVRGRWADATRAERAERRHEVHGRVRERLQSLEPGERRALRRRFENATPRERRALRREILRRTLTPGERARLRGLAGRGKLERSREDIATLGRDLDLDAEARRDLRARVRALQPHERRALQRQVSRYRSLSEAEQKALRERLMRLRSMDAEQRERLDANARRFRKLPEDEKQRMRDAWRRLREMPSAERGRLLDQLLEE